MIVNPPEDRKAHANLRLRVTIGLLIVVFLEVVQLLWR